MTNDAGATVGRVLSDARQVAILEWAKSEGKPTGSMKDVAAAAAEFYRLPYLERRKWYVRPDRVSVALAEEGYERSAEAIAAYRRSGDASHALKVVGMDMGIPWVEQKRNAQGQVEILQSDLKPPEDPNGDHDRMELAELEAREHGLYDAMGLQLPDDTEDEAEVMTEAAKALEAAREVLPKQDLAIFLLCEVDGKPLREVATEFRMSYRQVTQIVAEVKQKLNGILIDA